MYELSLHSRGKKVKSAYEPSGSSGLSFSQFLSYMDHIFVSGEGCLPSMSLDCIIIMKNSR